ncbi:phage major capsid protein, partial [bacterium]|nr:phage major capsid protein [bacterium]
MDEELKKIIADLNKAFADFKAENDGRLKEIEAKDHSDPLLTEKVTKITEDIVSLETMLQQLDAIENSVATMQAPGGDNAGEKPIYASIGEQLRDVAVLANSNPSGSEYGEARERLAKVQAAASGANEGIPSEGGFLVEKDSATMLDKGTIATGLLSQRCFNVPITGDSDGLKLKLIDESSRANGSRFGGIQVAMKSEWD